jgi:ER membrane protein complex subunit 3
VLNEKVEKKDMTEMMMTNPDAAMGMMKQQLGALGPQLALGAFVNFFFRGFILGKLPFALSPRFRGMLQSGIDLPSLDVSYLSSLSFYMLLLFGSRGLMILFFQDAAVNDAAMLAQAQMQTQMGFMNPAASDPAKAYASECQALSLTQHQWRMAGSEARAAEVLRRRLRG